MTAKITGRCGERIPLENRETVPLPRSAQCREIVCTDGVIWVTFRGDPADYLLKKGERLRTEENRFAVVSAIGRSEFSLAQDDGARERTSLPGLRRTFAT